MPQGPTRTHIQILAALDSSALPEGIYDRADEGFVGGLVAELRRAQGTAHETSFVAEFHRAGHGVAGAEMNFADSGRGNNATRVSQRDTAPGHYDEASGSLLLE